MRQTPLGYRRRRFGKSAPRLCLWISVFSLYGCGDVAGGLDVSLARGVIPGQQQDFARMGIPQPPKLAYRKEAVELHQLIYEGWGPPDYCPDGNFCAAVHKTDLDANCVFYQASACVNDTSPAQPWAPCKFYDETRRVLDPDVCFAVKKQVYEHRPLLLPDSFDCRAINTCFSDEATFNIEFVVSGASKKVSFHNSAAPLYTADFRVLRALVEELGFY